MFKIELKFMAYLFIYFRDDYGSIYWSTQVQGSECKKSSHTIARHTRQIQLARFDRIFSDQLGGSFCPFLFLEYYEISTYESYLTSTALFSKHDKHTIVYTLYWYSTINDICIKINKNNFRYYISFFYWFCNNRREKSFVGISFAFT